MGFFLFYILFYRVVFEYDVTLCAKEVRKLFNERPYNHTTRKGIGNDDENIENPMVKLNKRLI